MSVRKCGIWDLSVGPYDKSSSRIEYDRLPPVIEYPLPSTLQKKSQSNVRLLCMASAHICRTRGHEIDVHWCTSSDTYGHLQWLTDQQEGGGRMRARHPGPQ
ncbi:hypothetical protein ACTXT7_010569 [Hymenolepis weldensis]